MAFEAARITRVERIPRIRRAPRGRSRTAGLSAGRSVAAWLALASGRLRGAMATAPVWEQLSLADDEVGPVARANHVAQLWAGDTLVVFGGEGATEGPAWAGGEAFVLLGDLWALNLTEAFGSQDGDSTEDAGWQLLHEGLGELSDGGSDGFSDGLLGETGLSTGLLTEVSVIPSARSGVASAVATGSGVEADALVIFGGMVLDAQDDTTDSDSEDGTPSYTLTDELWAFRLEGNLGWQRMPSWDSEEGPTARYGATGSFVDGSFLVLGGGDREEIFGELWSYDLAAQTWELLSSPSERFVSQSLARWGHTSTLVPAEMVAGDDDGSSSGQGEKLVYFGGLSAEEEQSMSPASVLDLMADSDDSQEAGGGLDLSEVDMSPDLLRFGHSMVCDSRGLLWVYGGFISDVGTLSNRTLVMHLGSDDPFGSSPTSTSGTSSSSTSSTPLYRQRRLRSSRGDRSLRAASAAPAAATKAAAAITATRGARSGLVMAPRSPRQALDAPAEVQVSGADDGGLDRGGRKLSSSSRTWWEYLPETSNDIGPGELMHHGAVFWDGRIILHGGQLSLLTGHVSPTMWSLAIDVADGEGSEEKEVATAVSESLVQAEPDAVDDVQNLTGWTVSGVLFLTFVAALVAWMIKHVLSCALDKLRPHDDDDDSRRAISGSSTSASGIGDTAGLNGFTGAAPVPPRAVISSSSSRDRRGLTPAEIALLPVRHFVRPSVARSSTAGAVAGVTEKETCLLHGSGSGGGSRSGILEVELACRRQDGEARPPLPRMKRLRQGVASSSVSEATTPLSPSSTLSETATTDQELTGHHNSQDGGEGIITMGSAGCQNHDDGRRSGVKPEDQGTDNGSGSGSGSGGGGGGGRSTDETCAICLSGYVEHCSLRVLLPCEHVFHSGCVDEWLRRQGVCPICKARVNPCAHRASPSADAPGTSAGSLRQPGTGRNPEVGGAAGNPGLDGARAAVRAIAAWITPRAGGVDGGGGGSAGDREVGTAVTAEAMAGRGDGTHTSGNSSSSSSSRTSVAGGNVNGGASAPDVLLQSATPTGRRDNHVWLSTGGRGARPPTRWNSITITGLNGRRDGGGSGSSASGGNSRSAVADRYAAGRRAREATTVGDSAVSTSRSHSRGSRAAGPRGFPGALHVRIPVSSPFASVESGAAGAAAVLDAGTPGRMSRSHGVRVWESETADASVVATHYENPLFSRRRRS